MVLSTRARYTLLTVDSGAWQAAVYKAHKGKTNVGAAWRFAKHNLFWVTSRQAPNAVWMQQRPPDVAVYAFRQRDTSNYPAQDLLDHGDLIQKFRDEVDQGTLATEFKGSKTQSGNAYPSVEMLEDLLEHIRGVHA